MCGSVWHCMVMFCGVRLGMDILTNGSQSKDFYTQYINSRTWKLKRREVLKRDNKQCQTCLSGENLEVHHKTYEHLGNEPLEDLITLCKHCHEAITSSIRFRRYSKKGWEMLATVEAVKREQNQSQKKGVTISNSQLNNEEKEVPKVQKSKIKILAMKG